MTRALLALLLTAGVSSAQIGAVVTNYSSGPSLTNQFRTTNGYGPNFGSLDGTPTNAPSSQQWQTTDPFVMAPPPNTDPTVGTGATSQLQYMTGWTAGTPPQANKSVLWGGYAAEGGVLPGIANPQLYYDFNSVVTSSADSVSYFVDFGIIAGLSSFYTNRDTFGFSLLATNTNLPALASFGFNPVGASATNQLVVEWGRNGTNVVTNGTTFKGFEIQYGSLYRMTATVSGSFVSMSIAGLAAQTNGSGTITNYSVVTNVAIVTGGALSTGYTSADFERISLDWELASGDPQAPGSNYSLITAISTISLLTAPIPEPATWATAALLLSAAAYSVRRRNKLNA